MATAFAAAAASTTMATTDVLIPRLPTHCSALPSLPSRFSTSVFPTSLKKVSVSRKSSQLQIKASSSEESAPVDGGEILTDLKEKWDAVEDKSNVLLYGGGALVGIWLSSIIVGAINSVPLLPNILELVGLGYTGWFVYRYLLFKVSLASDFVYNYISRDVTTSFGFDYILCQCCLRGKIDSNGCKAAFREERLNMGLKFYSFCRVK